jgi:hypothetical protein
MYQMHLANEAARWPWWKKTATTRNSSTLNTVEQKCNYQNWWECEHWNISPTRIFLPWMSTTMDPLYKPQIFLFQMGHLPGGKFYFITDPCNDDQVVANAEEEEDARNLLSYFKPNKYDAASVLEDISLSAWWKSLVVDSARCSALSFGSTGTFPLGAPYGARLLKKWKTTSQCTMSNRTKPTTTMMVIAQ